VPHAEDRRSFVHQAAAAVDRCKPP
jgi:hypothetical protein